MESQQNQLEATVPGSSHDGTDLARMVGRIAALLGSDATSTGTRAALRRMSTGQAPLALYQFAVQADLPPTWADSPASRADWQTIVAGIALMAPGGHRPRRGLGQALAQCGYSDLRLERLLGSEGTTRRTLLLRAARFVAAQQDGFDWLQAARLLLTRDPDRRESLHRQIATDFYRHYSP